MPNMSYCRMRNTLNDLRDCVDNWDDLDDDDTEEKRARDRILELAIEIVRNYGYEKDVGIEYLD